MPEIVAISGVGPVLAKACIAKGFGSVEKIATAAVSELVVVPGVSDTRAKQLIGTAQLLLNGGTSPAVAAVGEKDGIVKKQTKKNTKEKKKKDGKKKYKKKKSKKNKIEKSKKSKKKGKKK